MTFRIAAMLIGVLMLPQAAGHAEVPVKPIQPGAKIFSPIGQCTANFVFEDEDGALYIGTAGHCARVGHRVSSEAGEFGTTVYSVRTTERDFALILIDETRQNDVSPAIRFWGGPTGVTTATETIIGEPLLQFGYGIGFGESDLTRRRTGPMSNDSFTRYRSYVPSNFGDSGSPVLHAPTGKALGVVVEFSYGTAFPKVRPWKVSLPTWPRPGSRSGWSWLRTASPQRSEKPLTCGNGAPLGAPPALRSAVGPI